jgi:hypothetical protein
MTTLLVMGSKPQPELPNPKSYHALACANASGRSALRYGLPTPDYTVISAIITSGKKPANDLAVNALRGLQTHRLVVYPRPQPTGPLFARVVKYVQNYKMNPRYVRWKMRTIGYYFTEFSAPSHSSFMTMFKHLAGDDPDLLALLSGKQPSTGIAALCLGLAESRYTRFILSGFSFEITHDYARNPLVEERGPASIHAPTDQALLRCLSERFGSLFTTEAAVHDTTGIPYI